MVRSKFVIIAAVFVLLLCASSAFAQQKCQLFQALYHQTLMVNLITNEGDWYMDADPVRGLLGTQPVTPTLEYKIGESAYPSAVAGRYWDYQQKWIFENGDYFIVGEYHATFPVPPGKAGSGTYNGTGKIVEGTGMFQGATGTELETGPFLMWVFVDEYGVPWLTGKYNGMATVRICTP